MTKSIGSEYPYDSNDRAELLPFVPPNVRLVLDVGCGGGNFGKLLKQELDCIVWGVEPHKTAALRALNNLDRVFNASFDSKIDFNGSKFDCVFFNDVLEHLIDPLGKLMLAKSLLCDGGHIICSIPNVLYYENVMEIFRTMDWKYAEAGILDRTHLRFFTRKSIERMFFESGMKIISISGIKTGYGKKFRLLNRISLNKLADMQYPQYIVVACIA